MQKGSSESQWSYLGGSIIWFDYCEADYMSMLELWVITKDLGYKDGVEFYGIFAQIRKVVHIGCEDSLLEFMRTVPKSNKRVICYVIIMRVKLQMK